AYFQAYSNTYAPVERLRALYDEALRHPAIVGLVIGTRPDCVDEEKLSYFQEIAKTKFIALEYGIESCYNNTLKKINRGHTFEEAVEAVNMTNAHGLHCGAHFILGLPFETEDMMLDSAAIISKLPINTVKFHQLQILRDTTFEQMYLQDPSHFKFFTFEEYVSFFIKFLERLNPEIIVERFSGEVPPRYLVNPGWGLIRNDQVIIAIEKEMQTQNTWQGKKYKHI
ncbi:MAG: TIGR01212 family radical SAM protein, partial [Bacteroidales bacterium]|nr:TIGR01212 family radical SAM protein [Bacteroidales bacterium]